MCNVLWDARDDWSGCPLATERIEIENRAKGIVREEI
jgi:hypothetical protein